MKVRILGSGTSHGVPVIGCSCRVCRSTDPRDARTRSSILVRENETFILIDASPEFRLQAISAGLEKLSAILVTHAHADHIHGLDDVRPLNRTGPLPVFGNGPTIAELTERFSYAFRDGQEGGGRPKLVLREVKAGKSFEAAGVEVLPIPVVHGELDILGYRIGRFSYITDASSLPEAAFRLLAGTECLVINGLRKARHPTHFSLEEAIAASAKIGAKRTYITHLCHESSHEELSEYLGARGAQPSYDGMEIDIE